MQVRNLSRDNLERHLCSRKRSWHTACYSTGELNRLGAIPCLWGKMTDYHSYLHTSHIWLVHVPVALGSVSLQSILSPIQLSQPATFITDCYLSLIVITQAGLQLKDQGGGPRGNTMSHRQMEN